MAENVVFVIRKNNGKANAENLGEFFRRTELKVRKLFDKFETVILDARGTSIMYACSMATSKNLENLAKVESVVIGHIDKQIVDNNNKKVIRVTTIRVSLKKISK